VTLITASVASVLAATGCRSSGSGAPPESACRGGAEDDVNVGARTAAQGVKTGALTGVEGVKTFGSSAVGLVEGGSDEARARWRDGKRATKQTAHEEAAETKREAHVPRCR
jgi:hypothetical protein